MPPFCSICLPSSCAQNAAGPDSDRGLDSEDHAPEAEILYDKQRATGAL